MSPEGPMAEAGLAPRRQMSIRFDQLKRTPAMNIFGLPELIGLAAAALIAILTVFAYFYFYVPAGFRLRSVELERQRLLGQRQASDSALQLGLTTKQSVDKINTSLTTFEGTWLSSEASGRMSLYLVLNKLIKDNGLRNTAGPTYAPLEPVGTKTQAQPTITAEKQSNAKWQSIYPGIAVSVTVEGPYQNVRHFVREIEMSRQFLIINAVELEKVTQSGVSPDQPLSSPEAPIAPRGGAGTRPVAGGGTQVSLRVDLATYFRRAGTNTTTP